MNLLEVLLLALVQGLTEFLPVSSSGHLALGQMLFGISEGNLMLSIVLHMGTLVATLVYFRAPIANILADGGRWLLRPTLNPESQGARDALAVVLASIPTAVFGLGFHDAVEGFTRSLPVVAAGFVVTTALLVATRFHGKLERDFLGFGPASSTG
jgi:undecaprenyl-diphosphatase